MGREKFIRTNYRKTRPISTKPNPSSSDHSPLSDPNSPSNNPSLNPNPNPNPNPNFDDSGWGYCTEDQLEELLLKNLEFIYQEALSKLVSLGYDHDVALNSVLRNGHWYGNFDILNNIIHNATTFINNSNNISAITTSTSTSCSTSSSSSCCCDVNSNPDEPELGFSDLRQLHEYSLAGMVCLLQQLRPSLSRGDAMWCLLMSDLHLSRASAIEIPVVPDGDTTNQSNAPAKFHQNLGFRPGEFPVSSGGFYDPVGASPGSQLASVADCPKRFDLSPSMESLLRRNVAIFAAGFRASSKLGMQSQARHAGVDVDSKGSDMLSSVLSNFGKMSICEKSDGCCDQKSKEVLDLLQQIKELEGQVKERKEWALQKALQAARKLANDLVELKVLRMDREETLRLKKGKQALEDTTMKRLSEMENALRKASGQVDRANANVRRLETENAEIKAEMQASKLSAEESVMACLEVARREKKSLKKLLAWEKQKTKLQEEVVEEKRKIAQLQQQLELAKEAQKEAEMKWRQEVKAKEMAIAQVEEERRAKEATEVRVKIRNEDLHRKIERDIQRYKDDIQRLEQELSHLKASVESSRQNGPSHPMANGVISAAKTQKEAKAKALHDTDKQDSSWKMVNRDRECLICMKEEVSVVFLPCAHQVLCASCSEEHQKAAKKGCPCCQLPIEQRVRVYGASS